MVQKREVIGRPETVEDLPGHLTNADTIFWWDSNQLAQYPQAEMMLVQAKIVLTDYADVELTSSEVKVRKSFEKLQQILVDQQERYDRGEELYARFRDEGTTLEWSERMDANLFAQYEKLPSVEKILRDREANAASIEENQRWLREQVEAPIPLEGKSDE